MCFSLLSVWYPESGSLPRTVFLIVTITWSPGIQAPSSTRARWSRDVSCVDCACLLAWTRQLKRKGGRACSLTSAMQQESALSAYTLGFSKGARECHDCSCLLATAWEQGSAATACPCWLQQDSRMVLQLLAPTGLSKAAGGCHVLTHPLC